MSLFKRTKKIPSAYREVKLITTQNMAWRRAVYIFFIVVFLITAPLVVLYSQGYRYNFKRGKVQKTGILIISSVPKSADIYLNNQLVTGDQTPARLEKLLPADYEIKLAKEGYHDWIKKLQIFENSTTFAENVILWKNNWPTQLAQYDIIDWLSSPDQQRAIFITKERKIISFDLATKKFYELYQAGDYDNLKLLNWSNTSKKILIEADNKYLIFNAERYQSAPVTINNNYNSVKWDLKNDNLIYGADTKSVWKIDLFSAKASRILTKEVSDFLINGDIIYFYYKDVIYRQKISGNSQVEIIDGLKCQDCKFINHEFDRLLLLDKKYQELFIIDPSSKNKTIKREAKNIAWLKKDTLLFYNNWEIWIYEIDKEEPEIITRIGTGIGEALWHPEGRHIIFNNEDKIKIIELDNRELRNVIELFSGAQINYLALDDKGRNIYFQATINDKKYLMELPIE